MAILDTIKNFFTPKTTQNDTGSSFNPTSFYKPVSLTQPKQPTIQPLPVQPIGMSVAPVTSTPTTSQINTTPVTNVVQDTQLNQQQYTLPQTQPMANQQLGATVNSVFQEPKKSPRDTSLENLQALIQKQGTQGEVTTQLMADTGLAEKQQYLADLNAKAMTTKRAYEKQIEELRKNPEGQLRGSLEASIQELSRKGNMELADIAIQQMAAQGNVEVAQKIIDQKIAAEFEPLKTQIQGYKDYLTLYGDDLTASEKAILESNLRTQEEQYKAGVENAQLQNQAETYQSMLNQGTITVDKVPKEVLGYLNMQGYVSPDQKLAKEKTNAIMSSMEQVLGMQGTAAIGPLAQQLLGKTFGAVGLGNFEADKGVVENLKALLTLDKLSYLKGSMSDKDIEFISNAASPLNRNMKEADFKKQLIKIQSTIVNGIVNSPAFSIGEKKTALENQLIREFPNESDQTISDMVNFRLQQVQPTFKQAGNASASNRPQRNNNPLNIKSSSFTSKFSGVSGTDPVPATDGGKFLTFATPEAGFQAAKKLITAPSYSQLSVEKALRRWSGNGYGAEIVPSLKNKTINQLSTTELDALIQKMAEREGYYA